MNTEDDIYDPLGMEIFLIEESFESVFNGLKGVYARLCFKESQRPDSTRDREREKMFDEKHTEFSQLKRSFRHNDYKGKRDAVNHYSAELKKMVALELSEYPFIRK